MARFVNGPSNYLSFYGGGLSINFNNISACAWVNWLGRYGAIIGSNSGSAFEFTEGISTFPKLVLNAQNAQFIGQSSRPFPITSGWHHVIVTYVNAGAFTFYVDGLPAGNGTSSNAFTTSSSSYFIGQTPNPPNDQLLGQVADLAWTKFIISPAEAWALGTGRMRPFTLRPGASNYLAYFPLDGSGGKTTETDYSGNGANATVNGSCPLVPGPPQLNPKIIVLKTPAAAASSVVFRKSLSQIGGRVGTRQIQAWG